MICRFFLGIRNELEGNLIVFLWGRTYFNKGEMSREPKNLKLKLKLLHWLLFWNNIWNVTGLWLWFVVISKKMSIDFFYREVSGSVLLARIVFGVSTARVGSSSDSGSRPTLRPDENGSPSMRNQWNRFV